MKQYLTPDDYRKAIYFDFEGEGRSTKTKLSAQPHMVGTFQPNPTGKSGKYEAFFFKENWKPARNGIGNAALVVGFEEYFQSLFEFVSRGRIHLIHWSIYERVAMKAHLSNPTFNKIEPFLYNLLPPAKRYANKRRAFGVADNASKKSLEEFFAVLFRKKSPFPPLELGAAEVCRRIDKACQKNKRWSKFSVKERGYVNDLIAYNKGDCIASWLIAKRLGNANWSKQRAGG
jgi:hypothetical protein